MWAWHGQFECLIGRKSDLMYQDGMYNGNISDGLAQAMDIKRWLERAAYRAGLEDIQLILLSELPQEEPVTLQPWQQRRVDDAMTTLEEMLQKVGWLAEKSCNRECDLI